MELVTSKMKNFKKGKKVFGEIAIFAVIFAVIFSVYAFLGALLEAIF